MSIRKFSSGINPSGVSAWSRSVIVTFFANLENALTHLDRTFWGQEWMMMVVGGPNCSFALVKAECMRFKALKVLSRENDLNCIKSR